MVVMEIGRRRIAIVRRRVLPSGTRAVCEGWFQNKAFMCTTESILRYSEFREELRRTACRVRHHNAEIIAPSYGSLADSAQFSKLIRRLHRRNWVVYAKPAFGGALCRCCAIWPLHPPDVHFQSSLVGLRTRTRHFPLEKLRPRRQTKPNDPCRQGVVTTLLSARAP
jgi:hypothetical protein